METHSSVLAWRIPGTGELGGLLSMGSHRVKHDWSSLAAAAMQETWVLSLGQEDPLEKEMATHSNILAWRIPWTKKPGRLQSMESLKSWTWWRTSTWTFHFFMEGWKKVKKQRKKEFFLKKAIAFLAFFFYPILNFLIKSALQPPPPSVRSHSCFYVTHTHTHTHTHTCTRARARAPSLSLLSGQLPTQNQQGAAIWGSIYMH